MFQGVSCESGENKPTGQSVLVPGEGIGGVCVGVGGGLRGLWVRGTPDYNRSSILSLPLHMFVVTVNDVAFAMLGDVRSWAPGDVLFALRVVSCCCRRRLRSR